MLEGCWRNTTDLTTHDVNTGQPNPVQRWEMCFDRNGQGRQNILWADGERCQGPLQARFEGGQMFIEEKDRCTGRRSLFQGRSACRRINDSEADCTRTQIEGRNAGATQRGRFTR
jgi:hypothetical protein